MAQDEADDEMYCERHNLKRPAYETTDPHCPYCREERRINAMEQEMHARRSDRSMHPTIDAPRY